jgi:hypothetical protein
LLLRQPAGGQFRRSRNATFGILTGAGALFASILNATVLGGALRHTVGSQPRGVGIDPYSVFPPSRTGRITAAVSPLLLSASAGPQARAAADAGPALAGSTLC